MPPADLSGRGHKNVISLRFRNEQKVRHLEQPSRRKTNWTNPPCDPVQIIRTKDWHFSSLIIINTATSYFFTNLHAIYIWNGHRERRFSHWYLQLHTRLAERYRWRCADLHSDWFHAVMTHSPFSVQFIEKILNRCKYIGITLSVRLSVCPSVHIVSRP